MVPNSFKNYSHIVEGKYYPNSGELLDILPKGYLFIIHDYVERRVWDINHNNEQVNAKEMWELVLCRCLYMCRFRPEYSPASCGGLFEEHTTLARAESHSMSGDQLYPHACVPSELLGTWAENWAGQSCPHPPRHSH